MISCTGCRASRSCGRHLLLFSQVNDRSWAPIPVAMRHPSFEVRARRFGRTVWLLAKHLSPAFWKIARHQEAKGIAIAHGSRCACEELGATYVKFAQLVASAPAVVGPEVADEFRGTLDRGPRVSYRQVREIFFEGTGKTIEEAFATFERKPFAAAPPEVRAYFLTWRTYGTWLPGDERGWVGRDRNGYGEPINSPDYRLENAAKGQMNQAPVELTGHQRRSSMMFSGSHASVAGGRSPRSMSAPTMSTW